MLVYELGVYIQSLPGLETVTALEITFPFRPWPPNLQVKFDKQMNLFCAYQPSNPVITTTRRPHVTRVP